MSKDNEAIQAAQRAAAEKVVSEARQKVAGEEAARLLNLQKEKETKEKLALAKLTLDRFFASLIPFIEQLRQNGYQVVVAQEMKRLHSNHGCLKYPIYFTETELSEFTNKKGREVDLKSDKIIRLGRVVSPFIQVNEHQNQVDYADLGNFGSTWEQPQIRISLKKVKAGPEAIAEFVLCTYSDQVYELASAVKPGSSRYVDISYEQIFSREVYTTSPEFSVFISMSNSLVSKGYDETNIVALSPAESEQVLKNFLLESITDIEEHHIKNNAPKVEAKKPKKG